MARIARGQEHVEGAYQVIAQARTVKELRMAQSVVLPLACGISLEQTASFVGVSRNWVNQLRNRFIQIQEQRLQAPESPGGRRHAYLSVEQEAEFLAPYLETARSGGVLTVPPIREALEHHLGRKISLSAVYRLLHRHGWRKLIPDTHHPKSDPQAQEIFKKTPRYPC